MYLGRPHAAAGPRVCLSHTRAGSVWGGSRASAFDATSGGTVDHFGGVCAVSGGSCRDGSCVGAPPSGPVGSYASFVRQSWVNGWPPYSGASPYGPCPTRVSTDFCSDAPSNSGCGGDGGGGGGGDGGDEGTEGGDESGSGGDSGGSGGEGGDPTSAQTANASGQLRASEHQQCSQDTSAHGTRSPTGVVLASVVSRVLALWRWRSDGVVELSAGSSITSWRAEALLPTGSAAATHGGSSPITGAPYPAPYVEHGPSRQPVWSC